jgi:hypothetical protein
VYNDKSFLIRYLREYRIMCCAKCYAKLTRHVSSTDEDHTIGMLNRHCMMLEIASIRRQAHFAAGRGVPKPIRVLLARTAEYLGFACASSPQAPREIAPRVPTSKGAYSPRKRDESS